MSTPHYFRIYDIPEFDARYGYDDAFTERCDAVALPLYWILAPEIRALRQVPGDCLCPDLWDLAYCAGILLGRIPHEDCSLEQSCVIEAIHLLKIACRMVEYGAVGNQARERLGSILNFVRNGVEHLVTGEVP